MVKLSAPLRCYRDVEAKPRTANSPNGADSPDALARRLANGDPSAPREMVERHRAELLRYATALLRDATSAEDAVQEAFGRAFDALGRYPEERIRWLSLRAWLYKITLNVVRNSWRGEGREMPVARVPERPGGVSPAAPEARLDALEALRLLPERQRTAVALRYLSDLPYPEISVATGWPEATCKTLVRRGLGRLRLLMSVEDDEGGTQDGP
jgi:RNA polymerase sigma-70 factor (ECF subfamily)